MKIIDNCKRNQKNFWSQVLASHEQDKANILNDYFSSVFVNEPNADFFAMNMIVDNNIVLDCIDISEKDVLCVINKLGISKASAPDKAIGN